MKKMIEKRENKNLMNLKHHSSGKKRKKNRLIFQFLYCTKLEIPREQSGETGILDDKELLKKGG